MQPTRPLSVTIIGWTLLAFSVIGLAFAFYLFLSTDFGRGNTLTLMIVFAAAFLLQAAMALGILKGANWARILFLLLTPTDVMVAAASGGITSGLIFKASYFVIFAFFLIRPDASAFFPASKGRDRVAYAFAICWIALGTFLTFLPEIMVWAEKTYRIGYIRHDTASLKLPADWKQMEADRPIPEVWYGVASRLGLETIAWGGMTPVPRPRVDLETGEVSQFDNKEAFEFQPGYERDDGSLMPCGLTRYQLNFPNETIDPLRHILQSQLTMRGDMFRHQYIWEEEWRLLEIDVGVGDARFIVWNWWRKEQPNHVIGMILGMREKEAQRQDPCGVSAILSTLEINRPDGSVWHAGELNSKTNRTMTPVSSILIEVDLDRFRQIGLKAAAFFSWLEKQLNDQSLNHSVEAVRGLRYLLTDTQHITLADVARVSLIGVGGENLEGPLQLTIVELITQCQVQAHDLQIIRDAHSSVTSLKISLKPRC